MHIHILQNVMQHGIPVALQFATSACVHIHVHVHIVCVHIADLFHDCIWIVCDQQGEQTLISTKQNILHFVRRRSLVTL